MQDKVKSLLRIPLFFGLFVLLGLVFGVITFQILSFSRTVEVPALSGMSLLEANEITSKASLYLKVDGEDYDSAIPSGKIIRQDIPAGNKVKEKRSIKVVVSKGPKVFFVPSVVHETIADAETALLQKGLRVGKIIYVHSDLVEKGRIVAQKPEPDDRVGDALVLLVSSGVHEVIYYCPDFTNGTLESARELAEKLGLKVETKGTGTIVRAQKPKASSPIKAGEQIFFELKEAGPHD